MALLAAASKLSALRNNRGDQRQALARPARRAAGPAAAEGQARAAATIVRAGLARPAPGSADCSAAALRPGPSPGLSLPSSLPRRAARSLAFAATVAATALVVAGAAWSNGNGNPMAAAPKPKNVLGGELSLCSADPLTGFMR